MSFKDLGRFNWILVFTWIILIFIVNPIGNFPLNDDWQYAYPVKQLVEQGKLEFLGVFAPNIILQVLWGYLFCLPFQIFDFTILRFSTLVIGGIGLYFFYRIIKEHSVNQSMIGFALLCLMLNPLFFSLSFSFMTDVPFLSLCLGSIWLFLKYLSNKKFPFFLGAMALALASFLIRQPGIILLPVFGLFLILNYRFSFKGLLTLIALLIITVFSYWGFEQIGKPWLGIRENYVPVSQLYLTAIFEQPFNFAVELVKKLLKTLIYLGFFSLPLFPFTWKKIQSKGLWNFKLILLIFVANACLLFYLHHIDKIFPFGGNVLYNFGLGPELLTDVYTLELDNTPSSPTWVMYLLNFISQFSASLLILLLIRSFLDLNAFQKKLILLLVLINAVYLPLMSITSFFDRYLLLPIASFFIIILQLLPKNIRKPKLLFLPFVLMSLFSVFATKDYLNWNRVKREAFLHLQEKGVSIKEMDAGYEYNGFYNFHKNRNEQEGKSYWWVNDDSYIIAFGPIDGYEEIASFPFFRWLFLKKDSIKVLERKKMK